MANFPERTMPKNLKPETSNEVDGCPFVANARDYNIHHREIIAMSKFLVGTDGAGGLSAAMAAVISEVRKLSLEGLVRYHSGVVDSGESIPMPEGVSSTTATGPLPVDDDVITVESTNGFPSSGYITKFNAVQASNFGPEGTILHQAEIGFTATAAGAVLGFSDNNVGGAAAHAVLGEVDGMESFILDSQGRVNSMGVRGAKLTAGAIGALDPNAGGVFVTGSDPDFHATDVSNSELLLQTAVDYVTFGKANPSILLITGLQDPGEGFRDSRDGVEAALGSNFDVADYGSGTPDVIDFSTLELAPGGVLTYDVIIVASDFGGWLTQAELDVLNDRTSELLEYVNLGGGLVVLSENGHGSRTTGFRLDDPSVASPLYGFLPFLKSAKSRHVEALVKDYEVGASFENFELISYESKTDTTFEGCTREVAGTAQELADGLSATIVGGKASLLLTHAVLGKRGTDAALTQFTDFVMARVAGTGVDGNSGDDGSSLRALLSTPADVAIGEDCLYIADTGNNRIRKVLLSGEDEAGKITHFAGSAVGTAGTIGDEGLATAALLDTPTGVAVDADGNVYIADTGNHRIRRVDAVTGIITNYAGNGTPAYSGDGGLAIAAELKSPRSVATDSFGNVWVADTGNGVIRCIDSDLNISSPFSDLADRVKKPWRVVTDSSGNVYVSSSDSASRPADSWRVFKVTTRRVNNVISTVKGATGIILRRFDDDTFYVATGITVYRHTISTNGATLVAGSSNVGYAGDGGQAVGAQFNQMGGLALDSTGNIYICDTFNHRIRKVDAGTGVITTIAGTGNLGFSGDGGPATAAALARPRGITVAPGGDLYFSDGVQVGAGGHRIRKIDGGGNISTVAGNGDYVLAADGTVATSGGFLGTAKVEVDPVGNVYVMEQYIATGTTTVTPRVRMISASDGKWTTLAGGGNALGQAADGGAATDAYLTSTRDMALDSNGDIYILEATAVRKIASSIITTYAGSGVRGGFFPPPPTPDFDNALIGDGGPATSASISSFVSQNSVNLDAMSISLGSTPGLLYILDSNQRIREVVPGESVGLAVTTLVAGKGGISDTSFVEGSLASGAPLNAPAGIAVGTNDVYVALTGGNRIVELDRSVSAQSAATVGTVAGTGTAGLSGDNDTAKLAKISGPDGMVMDRETGRVYFADSVNNVVRMLIPFTEDESTAPDVPNQFVLEHDAELSVEASMFRPGTATALQKYGKPVQVAYSMMVVGGSEEIDIDSLFEE